MKTRVTIFKQAQKARQEAYNKNPQFWNDRLTVKMCFIDSMGEFPYFDLSHLSWTEKFKKILFYQNNTRIDLSKVDKYRLDDVKGSAILQEKMFRDILNYK